jgi:tripeptide aminopeptidase
MKASTSKRLLEIFLDLVCVDATPGHERELLEYASDFTDGLGLVGEEVRFPDLPDGGTGNFLCRVGSGGDRVLVAHMDTVQSTADVRPVVQDGRVRSGGETILGADNRAGVACLLHLLERLKHESLAVRDFTIALTVREETDLLGSRNLLLPPSIRTGFVFDSSLDPGSFVHRSYGACRFRVEVLGVAAHAGLAPEAGVNAVLIAARALSGLRFGRLADDTVANVGRIEGGRAVNIVPDRAIVEGEVRSLSRVRLERVLGDIERAFTMCARESGVDLDFDSHWDFEPFEVHADAEVVRELEEALARVGLVPRPATSPGGSDANSLNTLGIEAVNLGIGARNPHSHDEEISLQDLTTAAEIALELVRRPE